MSSTSTKLFGRHLAIMMRLCGFDHGKPKKPPCSLLLTADDEMKQLFASRPLTGGSGDRKTVQTTKLPQGFWG